MIDIAVQRVFTPAGEHTAVAEIIERRRPVRPRRRAPPCRHRHGVVAAEPRVIRGRHHTGKPRRIKHRIQQDQSVEETGIARCREQRQHGAEAVAAADDLPVFPDPATMVHHLRHALGAEVPSREAMAVVAVAMALGVVQTQVAPFDE